jgi:hypothetical protein
MCILAKTFRTEIPLPSPHAVVYFEKGELLPLMKRLCWKEFVDGEDVSVYERLDDSIEAARTIRTIVLERMRRDLRSMELI